MRKRPHLQAAPRGAVAQRRVDGHPLHAAPAAADSPRPAAPSTLLVLVPQVLLLLVILQALILQSKTGDGMSYCEVEGGGEGFGQGQQRMREK